MPKEKLKGGNQKVFERECRKLAGDSKEPGPQRHSTDGQIKLLSDKKSSKKKKGGREKKKKSWPGWRKHGPKHKGPGRGKKKKRNTKKS